MKITIAYTFGEKRNADLIKAFVQGLIPGAKVRVSDRHAPFMHIYIASQKPEKT